MYKCGAIVVSSRSNKLIPCLTAVAGLVKEVLYVPLVIEDGPKAGLGEISRRISQLYLHVSKVNPALDLRVVLPPPSTLAPPTIFPPFAHKLDALFSPVSFFQELITLPEYSCIKSRCNLPDLNLLFQPLAVDSVETNDKHLSVPETQLYSDVALGGTFDCIHNGHRLLLAQAALIATRRVLVGVADGPLLANKTLMELIKPVDTRVNEVETILRDCKPELKIEVVPITDVFGPTAWDGELTCLVASQETSSALDLINEERRKKELNPLSLHTIQLLKDGESVPSTLQDKISSSDLRKRQLGIYRVPQISRCLTNWDKTRGPYLIGITGNTASGKSSVTKRLSNMGAYTIDCDKLGHKAYLKGTEGYSQVVAEFGKEVLLDNEEVDRKALGRIVFADKSRLKKLNEIVWPAIWRLVEEEVEQAYRDGYKVCVVDAAVLLQAEWDRRLHEVWVSIISPKEAIRRVVERDGITEERAQQRLSSQTSGREAVQHAHVVVCTQWEYEFTQSQVERAWSDLQLRLQKRSKAS